MWILYRFRSARVVVSLLLFGSFSSAFQQSLHRSSMARWVGGRPSIARHLSKLTCPHWRWSNRSSSWVGPRFVIRVGFVVGNGFLRHTFAVSCGVTTPCSIISPVFFSISCTTSLSCVNILSPFLVSLPTPKILVGHDLAWSTCVRITFLPSLVKRVHLPYLVILTSWLSPIVSDMLQLSIEPSS